MEGSCWLDAHRGDDDQYPTESNARATATVIGSMAGASNTSLDADSARIQTPRTGVCDPGHT